MTDDLTARLADVADKLERVRARGSEVFGASSHRMKLKKPWSEAKVAAFEARHGITLPPSYRAFVTTIGKAGAGPYYGLYGPKRWADFAEWIADEVPDDWLSRPSPLTPGANPLPDWDEDDDTPPEALAMYQGVMALGSRGCTYAMGLVITGPSRGRVVYMDADHHEPPYVVRDHDFLAWYARWLDEQLEDYVDDWFGYGPAGDEATLRAIIETTDDAELRREALANLRKLPAPSDTIWAFLDGHLDAGEDRALVVRLFERAPADRAPRILGLLDDADVDVRVAAMHAAIRLDREAAAEPLWARLLAGDPTRERPTAFHALKDAGRLDAARLRRIAGDADMGPLRRMALAALQCTPADAPLLVELLEDPHDITRCAAADALRGLGEALPSLSAIDAIRATSVRRLAEETDDYVRSAMVRLILATENHSAAPTLLAFAESDTLNDFARLEAIDALCRLGDPRVAPIARPLLDVKRTPTAPNRGHTRSIGKLVRQSLAASPDPTLRALAG